ncbi:MAG: hypothetical protein KAQ83_02820 [Nanoarchaeota archaeon]|nr:hypothetical protein [Nanoarchaeota archaeon]
MSQGLIVKHFIKEHQEIRDLIQKFFKCDKYNSCFTDLYNDLRNILKNHFSKEKSFFDLWGIQDDLLLSKLEIIFSQHIEILKILENIYEGDFSGKERLIEIINNHVKLEEENIYVQFDDGLSGEDKAILIRDWGLYEE